MSHWIAASFDWGWIPIKGSSVPNWKSPLALLLKRWPRPAVTKSADPNIREICRTFWKDRKYILNCKELTLILYCCDFFNFLFRSRRTWTMPWACVNCHILKNHKIQNLDAWRRLEPFASGWFEIIEHFTAEITLGSVIVDIKKFCSARLIEFTLSHMARFIYWCQNKEKCEIKCHSYLASANFWKQLNLNRHLVSKWREDEDFSKDLCPLLFQPGWCFERSMVLFKM